MQNNLHEIVIDENCSISRDGDDVCVNEEYIDGITALQDLILTVSTRPKSWYMSCINGVCGRDLVLNMAFIPYIVYDIEIGRNIISKSQSNVLYIDSLSYMKFRGKFTGPWLAIYVYQYHIYPPDKFDLLSRDMTLINLVAAAAKISYY